jgi:hypothetical protein
VRTIRPGLGFSWIDRRFLRDGWIERLERDEILLYFFLAAVADKNGLSYYSTPRIAGSLKIDADAVEKARGRLIDLGLIAYEHPLYQVLALETPRPRVGRTTSIGDILRGLRRQGDPTP